MSLLVRGWSISRRGEYWVVSWENSKYSAEITLSDSQYERFIHESVERLGMKEV
jgi:hypothetical protein